MNYRDARKLIVTAENKAIYVDTKDGNALWLLTEKALNEAETERLHLDNSDCYVKVRRCMTSKGKQTNTFKLGNLKYVGQA